MHEDLLICNRCRHPMLAQVKKGGDLYKTCKDCRNYSLDKYHRFYGLLIELKNMLKSNPDLTDSLVEQLDPEITDLLF